MLARATTTLPKFQVQRLIPRRAVATCSPHGQISSLINLITTASKVVEDHYTRSSKPYVPSLDDVEPHPLDSEISKTQLRHAIQTIEGACAQLSATVARPKHTMLNKIQGVYESICLSVALEFKVPDILQEKPSGMHISEIGQKSGLDEHKIGRILRLLATKHVFREVSDNVFANNRLSVELLSANPLRSTGLSSTDEHLKSAVMLSETLADPEWAHSYAPEHSPFNKYSKYPKSIFSYYDGIDTTRGAERGARFALAMIGIGQATESSTVIHEFPWKELGDGATVCDVGGGVGNITMQLAKAYPTLQLKLQDTPERIQQAKNVVWPKECPEAIAEGRIEFEPIDFLSESPIAGCNVYYLKNVIHNWSDADCIKILSGIRQVMAPHSKVLVHDCILQHANRDPDNRSQFHQAPEPLLPNYGVGRLRQYNLDIIMMCLLNGRERHLKDLTNLGELAGLRFERLWDCGDMGLVEYRLP